MARPLPNERDSSGARGGRKKDDLFWPDLFHILGSATEFAFKMGRSASRVAKPILSKFHVNFFDFLIFRDVPMFLFLMTGQNRSDCLF